MEKRSSELEETRQRASDLKRRVEIYAEMYEKKKKKTSKGTSLPETIIKHKHAHTFKHT